MFDRAGILTLAVLLGAGLVLTAGAYGQVIWYVDDDAPNDPGPGDPGVSDPNEDGSAEHPFDAIQEAIDAAANGDEVVVADGTYTGYGNRDLDFWGKAITVRSENGSDDCIIDCQDAGRGFYFHSEENADSVVDGFTISNGYAADDGAGMYCYPAGPTISNCEFRGNYAERWGGGAYCGGSTRILHCAFSDNRTDRDGGGICAWGDATITGCVFSENTAYNAGGGWFGGDATITNCGFLRNTAEYAAGANCRDAVVVADCSFLENTAETAAAGLVCSGHTLVTRCEIVANSIFWGGGPGGIGCADSSSISDCVIAYNGAEYGGGVYVSSASSPTVLGCTIVSNAARVGGGILCAGDGSAIVANCILWGNWLQQIVGPETLTVTYSDIEGGWPGAANIDADPLFVDPNGPDDNPYTYEDNDYRLSSDSPCIDAADNEAVPGWVTTDLDGRLRFADRIATPDTGNGTAPIVDMGPYEYQCTGDLDGDGQIDLSDLATLLAHYGTITGVMYADGDLDQDADVDLTDLATLLSVYGTTCE